MDTPMTNDSKKSGIILFSAPDNIQKTKDRIALLLGPVKIVKLSNNVYGQVIAVASTMLRSLSNDLEDVKSWHKQLQTIHDADALKQPPTVNTTDALRIFIETVNSQDIKSLVPKFNDRIQPEIHRTDLDRRLLMIEEEIKLLTQKGTSVPRKEEAYLYIALYLHDVIQSISKTINIINAESQAAFTHRYEDLSNPNRGVVPKTAYISPLPDDRQGSLPPSAKIPVKREYYKRPSNDVVSTARKPKTNPGDETRKALGALYAQTSSRAFGISFCLAMVSLVSFGIFLSRGSFQAKEIQIIPTPVAKPPQQDSINIIEMYRNLSRDDRIMVDIFNRHPLEFRAVEINNPDPTLPLEILISGLESFIKDKDQKKIIISAVAIDSLLTAKEKFYTDNYNPKIDGLLKKYAELVRPKTVTLVALASIRPNEYRFVEGKNEIEIVNNAKIPSSSYASISKEGILTGDVNLQEINNTPANSTPPKYLTPEDPDNIYPLHPATGLPMRPTRQLHSSGTNGSFAVGEKQRQ